MVNEKYILNGLNGIIEKEIRNVVDNSANENLENIVRDTILKFIKIGSIAETIDLDYETCFKCIICKVELDKAMMTEILQEIEKAYPSKK